MSQIHLPAGVITGENLMKLFRHASENNYAIPAVNCTSSSTINAVLEAARKANSPVIIQFSAGGCQFLAGKGLANPKDTQDAAVAGAIAGAHHVRIMAKHYGVPVVLHSDHCAKKLLGWFEGLVRADEAYYAIHGEPLFSSHMLDLSEEDLKENVEVCVKYFKRMAKVNCFLEMELGITGGEEDGVDNSGVDSRKFYTQPDEVHYVYKSLAAISPMFSIAAAFGNVHGVYKPGNVKLRPEILGNAQDYIAKTEGLAAKKPAFFVFHGGSGSEKDKIQLALSLGVVKMNIDTDTQWAYWNGVRSFEAKNRAYLQGQIGNPKGEDKPNKKFYDPRVWIRKGEEGLITRVQEAYKDLNSSNRCAVASKL
jgi:fructose-bisphosphate aldolase class II